MSRHATLVAVGLPAFFTLVGCGSSGAGGSTPLVTQTGTAVSYHPCGTSTPVAGATIAIGSHTATTDDGGTYAIEVPSGVPFTMTVSAPGYIPLTEAKDTVTASYDRGNTLLISTSTAALLEKELPSYDPTASLLTIELVKTGSCADVTGTTVEVTPANADAVTQYPLACVSPIGGTSATDGTFPSASAAVVYNLAAGTYSVTAKSATCEQVPYPYTDPTTGLTYDGMVTTQAGNANAFTRVFLK